MTRIRHGSRYRRTVTNAGSVNGPDRLVRGFELLEDRSLLAVLTVTTTDDAGPGSLRQAILDANSASEATEIRFELVNNGSNLVSDVDADLPGGDLSADVFVIRPLSPLPPLRNPSFPTSIEGPLMPFDAEVQNPHGPDLVLDGSLAGSGAHGLVLETNSHSVRNLNIQRFSGDGIAILGWSNSIYNCYIGTDATGTRAIDVTSGASTGNGSDGISVSGGFNLIGLDEGFGNIISGNNEAGMNIGGPNAVNNHVGGNRIGTTADGSEALGNRTWGIILHNGANSNFIGVRHFDLTREWFAGNVIAGSGWSNVSVQLADDNVFAGNLIGSDSSGTRFLGGGAFWITSGSQRTRIGTDSDGDFDSAEGNLLATGLDITAGSNRTVVTGNRIGTNLYGDAALQGVINGNLRGGYIHVNDSADNQIGSSLPGAGNIISGSPISGITIVGANATHNRVEGNLIGVDVTGTSAIANGGSGIFIQDAPGNVIGGNSPAMRNVISGNTQHGVYITGQHATSNAVIGNYIGTDSLASKAIGNKGAGVFVNAPANQVGGAAAEQRNIISGNLQEGVALWGEAAQGNSVEGNYIGLDVTGSVAIANGLPVFQNPGVRVGALSSNNTIRGNVISGNDDDGVSVDNGAFSNLILENRIGTETSGTIAVPNTRFGVILQADAHNNTVQNNVISGNDNTGVVIAGSAGTTGNRVVGNKIGVDSSGTVALANRGDGVSIGDVPGNIIGGVNSSDRNIIGANTGSGVRIGRQNAFDNQVVGNWIGVGGDGTMPLGNGGSGIVIEQARSNIIGGDSPGMRNVIADNQGTGVYIAGQTATANRVSGNWIGVVGDGTIGRGNRGSGIVLDRASNNTIGGESADARNIISANAESGIVVAGSEATQNRIVGNYIGSDVTGNLRLGNLGNGVTVAAPDNRIGGTLSGSGNLISANGEFGINVQGVTGTAIQGNRIGTNASGTAGLGNRASGIVVFGSETTIGGAAPGAGNLISDNDFGVFVQGTSGVVIQNNMIGTDITGQAGLGNTVDGIRLTIAATGTTIGGVQPFEPNVIAYNGSAGIWADDSAGGSNRIRGNSVFANGGLGLDLGTLGVTANDPDDNDAGPNGLQNFPVLTAASVDEQTTIGTFQGKPLTRYDLDFYANIQRDPANHGEGQTWVGTESITTDANGFAVFSAFLRWLPESGVFLTATATETETGNTSEFSAFYSGGPPLEVTIEREAVGEGLSVATTGRVRRIGSTANELIVQLNSSDTSEANVPASVIIPAGSETATFPIATVDDSVLDGNQVVTVTASAQTAGLGDGFDIFVVTDLNLPDLRVQSLVVPGSVLTQENRSLTYRVINEGLVAATGSWRHQIYLSNDPEPGGDTVIGDFRYTGTLPVDRFVDQPFTLVTPLQPGDYWVVVVVDAEESLAEILDTNNTFVTTVPIHVEAAYSATLETDITHALPGTPVTMSGRAVHRLTGTPAANVPVNVDVEVRGTHRVFPVVTDSDGRFTYRFQPIAGEAGIYHIAASHPGVRYPSAQDTFTLIGMQLRNAPTPLRLVEGDTHVGRFRIENVTDVPLTGLVASVVSLPDNVEATVRIVDEPTLSAFGAREVEYEIHALTPSSIPRDVRFRIASIEGPELGVSVQTTVVAPTPQLIVQPISLTAAMVPGDQRSLQFTVTNQGGATAEQLHLVLPDAKWLSIAHGPAPSLPSGEATTITLLLTPPQDLPLGFYRGSMVISGANTELTLPFEFRAVSEAQGDLEITVVDDLTFYAEGAPKLSTATVIIRDALNGQLIREVQLAEEDHGVVVVTGLTETFYDIEVSAAEHLPYRATIQIVANQQNRLEAFLPIETIRHTLVVDPTQVTDETNVTIETTFKTNVPLPLVKIESDVTDLTTLPGPTSQINLTVTNYGLIEARNVALNVSNNEFYTVTPLVASLPVVRPGDSVIVPAIVQAVGFDPQPLGVPVWTVSLRPIAARLMPSPPVSEESQANEELSRAVVTPTAQSLYNTGNYKCLLDAANAAIINLTSEDSQQFYTARGSSSRVQSESYSVRRLDLQQALFHASLAKEERTPPMWPSFPFPRTEADAIRDGVDLARFYYTKLFGDHVAKAATPIRLVVVDDLSGALGPAYGKYVPSDDMSKIYIHYGLVALACACEMEKDITYTFNGRQIVISRENVTKQLINRAREMLEATVAHETVHWIEAWSDGPEPIRASEALAYGWENKLFHLVKELPLNAPQSGGNLNGRNFHFPLPTDQNVSYSCVSISANAPYTCGTTSDGRPRVVNRQDSVPLRSNPCRECEATSGASIQVAYNNGQSPGAGSANIEYQDGGTQSVPVVCSTAVAAAATSIGADGIGDGHGEPANAVAAQAPSNVCATVTMRLSQTGLLTRDALSATLAIENVTTSPIENLGITLSLIDELGQERAVDFDIRPPVLSNVGDVTGNGAIQPNSTGTANWTIVPLAEAAPNVPTRYRLKAILRYHHDGRTLTIPLESTEFTVNPSPSIALKYFQERDVFGDNPFTQEVTEASVPFALGVMAINRGNGAARDVRIVSAKPRVVADDRGLDPELTRFEITGTAVNGRPQEPTLTVNLGDIAAHQTSIGIWSFTSPIQGHFTEYHATLEEHRTNTGRRLSLIETADIFELRHIVRATGMFDDGLPDFLTNDVPDSDDLPDTLHLSDGSVASVELGVNPRLNAVPGFNHREVVLTSDVSNGWTYLNVRWDDLTADALASGHLHVERVIRSDGSELLMGNNVWQTDRTFAVDGDPPIMERRLHLFDYESTGVYTLVLAPAADRIPLGVTIDLVVPNPRTTATSSIALDFSTPPADGSLGIEDILLSHGNELVPLVGVATVTKESSTRYRIDGLALVTNTDGEYELTIDLAGITDQDGFPGLGSVSTEWSKAEFAPFAVRIHGHEPVLRNSPVDTIDIEFVQPIISTSFSWEDATLVRNSGTNLVDARMIVTPVTDRTYRLSGLQDFNLVDGNYELTINTRSIIGQAGSLGFSNATAQWTLDSEGPSVSSLVVGGPSRPTLGQVTAMPDSAIIEFTEPIDRDTFDTRAIKVVDPDGMSLDVAHLGVTPISGTRYRISGLDRLTTQDGNYLLVVDARAIRDLAGNPGMGHAEGTWTLDQIPPVAPTNLRVTDRSGRQVTSITNTPQLTVHGDVMESGLVVEIVDATTMATLASTKSVARSFAMDVVLAPAGNHELIVWLTDASGNRTSQPLPPIFLDISSPVLLRAESVPDSFVRSAVPDIDVVFSAPIDLSTFTWEDISLTRDNSVNLITDRVSVAHLEGSRYRISNLGDATVLDGVYRFNIRADQIMNELGSLSLGSIDIAWLKDTVLPTSVVQPLARRQSLPTFTITVTGEDRVANPASIPSEILGFDILVSRDGRPFEFWRHVPVAQPTAVFEGESNHRYAFRSIAIDRAGNVEEKPVRIEASTYVPDVSPPTTMVSGIDAQSSTFVVSWSGSDFNGVGLYLVDLYVSIDGGVGTHISRLPAGRRGTNGVYEGSTNYQAIADGRSHTYRFYTVGTDRLRNVESIPVNPDDDRSITALFTPPMQYDVTSFDVQKGATQRSYIRYLDLTFSDSGAFQQLMASVQDADSSNDRIQLFQQGLDGIDPARPVSLAASFRAVDRVFEIDFGVEGLGGRRNGAEADGYYELTLDLDGDGTIDRRFNFYRLLGDVNGDRVVNASDIALVTGAFGQVGERLEEDVNGDGVVNALDRLLAARNSGRRLASGLPLDD
jgi:parallel beta-helix repeat protein